MFRIIIVNIISVACFLFVNFGGDIKSLANPKMQVFASVADEETPPPENVQKETKNELTLFETQSATTVMLFLVVYMTIYYRGAIEKNNKLLGEVIGEMYAMRREFSAIEGIGNRTVSIKPKTDILSVKMNKDQ